MFLTYSCFHMQSLLQFLKPSFSLKREYILLSSLALITAALRALDVELLKRLTHALENKQQESFYMFIGIFLVVKVGWLSYKYLRKKIDLPIMEKTRQKIYNVYMHKFITMNATDAASIGTWRMVSILQKGTEVRWALVLETYARGLREMSSIIIGLIMLTQFGYQVFLSGLGIIVLLVAIAFFIVRAEKKVRIQWKNVSVAMTRLFVRQIMAKFEILQAGKVNEELDSMCFMRNTYINKKLLEVPYKFGIRWIIPFILDLAEISGYLLIGINYLQWKLTLADLVTFMAITRLIKGMSSQLLDRFRVVAKNIVHVEKLRETFSQNRPIYWYNIGNTFIHTNGNITIKNMSFWYEKSRQKLLFKDFNISIPWGKKTALVGHSWSWKSTLAKLIAWYLSPWSGEISIDNQHLPINTENGPLTDKTVTLKSYFKHVGYLTQDPMIFDGTIRENLVYWVKEKVNEKELVKAIELAQCHFVHKLKNGLQTEIGERGVRLSGWQRQRLAIAKMFIRNPEIIILDEPTSALDSISEDKVTKAMHNLFMDRTVIIIAHRLQTVKEADEILVMKEWHIIERWSHNYLTKLGGHYKNMVTLQSAF